MPNFYDYFKPLLFAHDTTLSCMKDDEASLRIKCNKDLDTFHKWITANKLSVNQSKTKCMLITNRTSHSKLNDMSLQFEAYCSIII